MNKLQIINAIAKNTEFDVVVINDSEDFTPMEAIEHLSDKKGNWDGWEIDLKSSNTAMLIYTI